MNPLESLSWIVVRAGWILVCAGTQKIRVQLCEHRRLNLASLAIIREQSVGFSFDVVQLRINSGTNGPFRTDLRKRPLVIGRELGLLQCGVTPACRKTHLLRGIDPCVIKLSIPFETASLSVAAISEPPYSPITKARAVACARWTCCRRSPGNGYLRRTTHSSHQPAMGSCTAGPHPWISSTSPQERSFQPDVLSTSCRPVSRHASNGAFYRRH
jgi:hypothetical protein